MRWSILIVALFALAIGCEPAWSVQGHVQPAQAAAVVAASATLRCPGESDRVAHADQDGLFEIGGSGAGPSLACTVLVSAPGHASISVALREACEDPVGDRCSVAMIEAPLSTR